ncbi:MAG: hypothetical protein [Circular genetic element sp.]|nr:MAG: hypothetical protein [Circular genetic element sp.]
MAQSPLASTVNKLYIDFNNFTGEQYVDLAQCLSLVNRRFYRQGMNYAVENIKFYANNGGSINCYKVPTTWVADNATTKAFENWKEQRAEVLKESPSLKARWSDFKIFLDAQHVALGMAGNLVPAGTSTLTADWEASEFVVPITGGSGGLGNAQEVTMHVVGDHLPPGPFNNSVTSASLIKSYADSRSIILAPDPVQPPGYNTNMYIRESSHDEMAADIIQNVTNFNDNPPYDLDDYPGGDTLMPYPQVFDAALLNNLGDSFSYSTYNTGPFIAPLGLLRFDPVTFDPETQIFMEITLAPGAYKGILAERGV